MSSSTTTGDCNLDLWQGADPAPPSLFRLTHGLINRLVTTGDIAALLISGLVAPMLDYGSPVPLTAAQGLLLAAIQAAAFVAALRAVSAYRFEKYAHLGISLSCVAVGLVCAWGVGAGFIAAFVAPLLAATPWFVVYPLLQLAALVALRIGVRIAVGKIDSLALMRRNTIVVGCGSEAEAVVQHLTDPRSAAGFNVAGVVSDADHVASGLFCGRPLLGGLSALAAFPGREAIDLVVIATPAARVEQIPQIVDALQWLSADVVLRLDESTMQTMGGTAPRIAGQAVLPLMYRPLKGTQSLVKMIEDRVIAAVALAVASPLLLLIALAIRLDSPGPALFRQDRVGLYNRTFRIFKFRTMTVDPTDDGSVGTNSRHNPRITRVGGVLRSLSLDELPQLLNVLFGDMSIVGPRPYVRNMRVEDQTFQTIARSFAARHRIKPGITGLAQASGLRSNALRSKENAEMSVQLDMEYIAKWSLWLDLQIMVRTITCAMRGPEVF
jgi:putative colanic acid biosynthesis UDP-glucose lipid carrier transferase